MKKKSQQKHKSSTTESDIQENKMQEQHDNGHTPVPEPSNDQQPVNTVDESLLHDLCEEKIKLLEARLEETNDKFLRLFSEFDNYRKRTAKERLELTKTATADIISAMLPVLDDLERAASLTPDDDASSETGKQGLLLIINKFKTILRQKGVEEIQAIGEPFSTDYHEAVTHIPADKESNKGLVVDEIQKGYLLNGKVIRYARVVVAN